MPSDRSSKKVSPSDDGGESLRSPKGQRDGSSAQSPPSKSELRRIGSAETLGWDDFNFKFDPGAVNVIPPNISGNFGEDLDSYAKQSHVRKPNCSGKVGDAEFRRTLNTVQDEMAGWQKAWRLLVLLCPILPHLVWLAMLLPAEASVPFYIPLAVSLIVIIIHLFMLKKCILKVKGDEIVFVQLENSATMMLMPGMHILAGMMSERSVRKIDEDSMEFGSLKFVRVVPGQVGLAYDNGVQVILLQGLHLYNSSAFKFKEAVSVSENRISHGTMNIVRVPQGQYGLVTVNGSPWVLQDGMHFIDIPAFSMDPVAGFKSKNTEWIAHGQVHIIMVPMGKICSVKIDGEGAFLTATGQPYMLSKSVFEYIGMYNEFAEYCCAGTRHRVVVPAGKIGLAKEAGEPLLLEAGNTFLKVSGTFEYTRSIDLSQQLITHLSVNIVTVRDGQYGISYDDGVLEILHSGRHILARPTHIPAGFITASQETLRIPQITGMSGDNVEIRFNAALCMRVVDPVKAVVMLTKGSPGGDLMREMYENLRERAKLALAICIGNNSLNKRHAGTQHAQQEDGEEKAPAQEGGGFRSQVHDGFMKSFSKSMLAECGIQVIDMSIEDVEITNKALETAMASAAVANSNLEKVTIEAELVQVKADADSKVALINAHGQAEAMSIMADADAARIKTISQALDNSCIAMQQVEAIKASGNALGSSSTVFLAENSGALATLLGGAQGAKLGPSMR